MFAHQLFYLFIPLAILVTVVICVFVWRRETKKSKARIERMYAEGLLRRPKEKPAVIDYDVLPEIVKIISRGDGAIAAEMESCAKDHAAYFENHRAEYAERGIYSIDGIEKEELCWMCMVDLLADNHYAVEIDWKTETEDILYNLNFIAVKIGLPIDMETLGINDERIENVRLIKDEDDSITWAALCEISTALKPKGSALGFIDIESDSYVLFLTEENQNSKETLIKLANRYGRTIGFEFQRSIYGTFRSEPYPEI